MTTAAQIAPSIGSNGNSYEWILDVGLMDAAGNVAEWHNIPDMTALAPSSSATTADGTTYANKGKEDTTTVGEQFTLGVNVKVVTDNNGDVIPGLELLIDAANNLIDADGAGDRVIAVRYYHYKIAKLAYKFTTEVTWTRANTGNTDVEFMSFSFTAKGDRAPIANPALTPIPEPTISGVTPTGAAQGDIVRIAGGNLKGFTSVKFGTVEAAAKVLAAGAIYATLPAGTAGAANVTVTTPGGVSNAFAYTRA